VIFIPADGGMCRPASARCVLAAFTAALMNELLFAGPRDMVGPVYRSGLLGIGECKASCRGG